MAKRIEDLLHRRSDLSTFLVHLTRDQAGHPARDNLLAILHGQVIEARSPMGLGGDYWRADPEFEATQRTVCFTETPLEHVWMMCEEIDSREVKLKPYGVVFTKPWARRKGVNPVMYVDTTPSGHDWLTNPINLMLVAAAEGKTVVRSGDDWRSVDLAHSPVARLAPFIETMGTNQVRKEWWWEREWRHAGHVSFRLEDLVAVLVPEDDHDHFAKDLSERLEVSGRVQPSRPLRYLDPCWGQERMIAALADVAPENLGPFPI